jgi:hypothetical protein
MIDEGDKSRVSHWVDLEPEMEESSDKARLLTGGSIQEGQRDLLFIP